jgi:hypothetical protein
MGKRRLRLQVLEELENKRQEIALFGTKERLSGVQK